MPPAIYPCMLCYLIFAHCKMNRQNPQGPCHPTSSWADPHWISLRFNFRAALGILESFLDLFEQLLCWLCRSASTGQVKDSGRGAFVYLSEGLPHCNHAWHLSCNPNIWLWVHDPLHTLLLQAEGGKATLGFPHRCMRTTNSFFLPSPPARITSVWYNEVFRGDYTSELDCSCAALEHPIPSQSCMGSGKCALNRVSKCSLPSYFNCYIEIGTTRFFRTDHGIRSFPDTFWDKFPTFSLIC